MSSHKALSDLIQRNQAADVQTTKLARYLVQRGVPNVAVTTANQTVADDTLTSATELQLVSGVGFNGDHAVVGGRTYRVEAYLPCTASGASAGFAVTLGAGSCAASDVQLSYTHFTATAVATTNTVALDTVAGGLTTGVILVRVAGTFKATNSGSLGVQFAEAADVSSATLLAGAYLSLTEIAA